jgi:hypothetical protein
MQFLLAFIPAFLSTAVAFGVVYVLGMKALKRDRKAVEDWFEMQRKRFESGPIPVLETAQPVMIASIYAIYGRDASRRFGTSFLVGVFFTSIIFGSVYWRYSQVSSVMHDKKEQLEREADPKLYDYFTNPQLRPVYDRSLQMRAVKEGQELAVEYVYKGGIYDELRKRREDFEPHLVQRLFSSSTPVELTFLFISEGSYIDPGFQWMDSCFLFSSNVLLDFASVTLAIACLRRLGSRPSVPNALLCFAYFLFGTLACASVALLSYRMFFRGDPAFFWQVLVVLPLSLSAAIFGIAGVVLFPFNLLDKNADPESRNLMGLFWAVVIGWLGISGIAYVWSYWKAESMGIVTLKDVVSFPYILACTTLVPATVCLIVFGLILVMKVIAEPMRILSWAYLTFFREEVGGRQAAGVILIISALAASVFSVIWPAT